MKYSWGFFGIGKKVYATKIEQKLISEKTGLTAKPIYSGDEAIVVMEFAKQELRSGRAKYRDSSDELP